MIARKLMDNCKQLDLADIDTVMPLGGPESGGLVAGLFIGLFIRLEKGRACLQHLILRFLLWRNNYAPWHYVRFLDYAAERVFLRKVGGGYVFFHGMLLEYFATPADKQANRQT